METATLSTAQWVYSFSDYQQMYDLTPADFKKSILDFSAGIASFNAEATTQKISVISADPLYALSEARMKEHAQRFLQKITSQLQDNPDRLRENSKAAASRVIQEWAHTERLFLQDYAAGKSENRYQSIPLSHMPYVTHQFGLALCTDFIFHESLSKTTALKTLQELCRISEEVRIFPLLDGQGKMVDALGEWMLWLQHNNYGVEVRQVPYHTLKGGNAMLRVWEQECQL